MTRTNVWSPPLAPFAKGLSDKPVPSAKKSSSSFFDLALCPGAPPLDAPDDPVYVTASLVTRVVGAFFFPAR